MSICSSSDVDRYQESFSLSSFDFHSSLGGLYNCDDDDNNDVEAYIEIELEPAKMAPSATRENKGETDVEEEVEFRISISRKSSSANMFSFPATCSGDAGASAAGSKILSNFPPTWKRMEPPVDDEDFQSNENEQNAKINRELLNIRKAPKTKGGVMKILVKFRSSLNKLFPQKASRNGERSKLLEIKLVGMRKLFGAAVGLKTANQTKSCPNSSPVNENKFNARENSVQAAIAHCKKSFGQADDFCFQVPGRATFCGLK